MADETIIQLHYLKSAAMTTVYADGVYGGVTPRGMISMALYNERHPIPQRQEATISEGELVGEKAVETKEGIIRQVDCEVFMTPEVALSLSEWLSGHARRAIELRDKGRKRE